MGMYTGLRFKGYVKEAFRNSFTNIALQGEWSESSVAEFKDFGNISRSCFIPCGMLSYMPDCWEEYYTSGKGEREIDFGIYYKQVDSDGFNRTYNNKTGYWTFQCSLKNYKNEIEAFFELIPFFIDKIEHLEYFYEEWEYSNKYDLINNAVELITDEFIQYD